MKLDKLDQVAVIRASLLRHVLYIQRRNDRQISVLFDRRGFHHTTNLKPWDIDHCIL